MWKSIIVLGLVSCVNATADEARPKPAVSVEFCGKLRNGVMAIGGECTGTTISHEKVIWEVKLNSEAQRSFAKQHHKNTVVVTGNLRKVTGIETKDRWIIDVEKLSELDTTKHKPGVQMRIVGQLQFLADRQDGPAAMAIKASDQVWITDFFSDTSLKITAESAIGQQVTLTATVKQPTQQDPSVQPELLVKTIKQQPNLPTSRRNESAW